MASNKDKRVFDDGPDGPGEWIVTFSDCMTLLLCFFVLLLTFSSFEKVTLKKLAGAFSYETMGSIFPHRRTIPDSMVQAPEQPSFTDEGAETKTDDEPREIKNPRKVEPVLNSDAYRARRVFYIASEDLFWSNTLVLRDGATAHLDRIAAFLDVAPCFVIITESRSVPGPANQFVQNACLERAWQLVKYCVEKRGASVSNFSVMADGGRLSRKRFGGRGMFEIALIHPAVYK